MFTLVHSPLVGPLTWGPVAERLDATVASLVDLEPPYWRSVAEQVAAAITEPAIVVAHSNAGLFVPVIAEAAPVAGCLIVDGRLPGYTGRDERLPAAHGARRRSPAAVDRMVG